MKNGDLAVVIKSAIIASRSFVYPDCLLCVGDVCLVTEINPHPPSKLTEVLFDGKLGMIFPGAIRVIE